MTTNVTASNMTAAKPANERPAGRGAWRGRMAGAALLAVGFAAGWGTARWLPESLGSWGRPETAVVEPSPPDRLPPEALRAQLERETARLATLEEELRGALKQEQIALAIMRRQQAENAPAVLRQGERVARLEERLTALQPSLETARNLHEQLADALSRRREAGRSGEIDDELQVQVRTYLMMESSRAAFPTFDE